MTPEERLEHVRFLCEGEEFELAGPFLYDTILDVTPADLSRLLQQVYELGVGDGQSQCYY